MKIELSFNNHEESFVIPINPATIEITQAHVNTKVNILNVGEINLKGKCGLTNISFSSFFPSEKSPHRKRADRNAEEYVSLIKKWKNSDRPIRVIITTDDINLPMLIDNFSETITEGLQDIKYTINLSEYRFLKVPKIKKTIAKTENKEVKKDTGLKERPTIKPEKKVYTVKSGDYLWAIAERELGDGKRYPEIYNANKEMMDKKNKRTKKYMIYAGQRLVIPN